jgi:HlyD family secretion protein
MSLSVDAGNPYTGPERRVDDPRRELMVGGALIAIFFGAFVGWAALAPLDASVSAAGVVIVTGHRQTVQSRDVGTVTGLFVHEGDRVQAGQLLVQLGADEAQATDRALSSQVIRRQAEIARLNAEEAGLDVLSPPPEFAGLTGADKSDAEQALAAQQADLTAQMRSNRLRHAVLRQRVEETAQQIDGYQRQLAANQRQQDLNDQELTGVRSLEERGYAPASRVLALERSAASLDGDAGAARSEVARLRGVAGETELEIIRSDSERTQEVTDQLQKAGADLQTLLPQQKAAREALSRTQVRAPISGTVLGLAVNTIGGVVGAGQKLMDIVPRAAPMLIETHVPAQDAGDLTVGQTARIRFSAMGKRDVPTLKGTLTQVSADSQVDEKTGRAFYTADVTITPTELAKLGRAGGAEEALRPGLPVQVMIAQHKRSALQYMLEPLTQAFWGAMRER